jgi:hypothetical protein
MILNHPEGSRMIFTALLSIAAFATLRGARNSTLRRNVGLSLLLAAAACATFAEGPEVGLATFALVAMLAGTFVALAGPLLPKPGAVFAASLMGWLRNH